MIKKDKKMRVCLSCDNEFESEHNMHRICDPCRFRRMKDGRIVFFGEKYAKRGYLNSREVDFLNYPKDTEQDLWKELIRLWEAKYGKLDA